MVSRVLLLLTVSLAVLVVIGLQGIEGLTGRQVFAALFYGQDDSYAQAILLYQRIPRMLVALYAGAMLAVSGLALQVLVRNPLASPGSLGVSAAATCFGVVAGVLFDASPFVQGMAALAGAGAGILCLLMVALYAGRGMKSGAVLILSGAFVSMLFTGITRAVLLQYPDRRLEFMNWSMGSVNPAYVDRLAAFWWIGVLSVLLLLMLGRPLAAMMMGDEKAASVGVDTRVVRLAGMVAALACGGSAVVVSGPLGFVGLVVPHMVRPVAGNRLAGGFVLAAVTGAALCVSGDWVAQTVFRPYTVNTGVVLDMVGGVAFMIMVRHFYMKSRRGLGA